MPVNPTTLRIMRTTRELWSKQLSDQTVEKHALLKLMQGKGRLQYGCTGTAVKWTVKYKRIDLVPYADMDALNFARNTTVLTATLDWRGYKLPDAISELELAMNEAGNDTQIIDLFKGKLEQLSDDANEQIGAEFYKDGNATGNEKRLHGIESFLSVNAGAQLAADQYATTLNDTYAGLLTAKGNYGGLATDSPIKPEYEFWSPVVVNTTYNGETFATSAVKQIRRAISQANKGGKGNNLDLIVMTRENFNLLKNQLDDKQRQVIPATDLAKFGFPDTVNVDGVDCTWDPDVPATDPAGLVVDFYGFNTGKVKFKLLGKKKMLWGMCGDTFREENMTQRFWCGMYGNLCFDGPRFFAAGKRLGGS